MSLTCGVSVDYKEPTVSQTGAPSSVPLPGTNDPTAPAATVPVQSASEFDFNEFFQIDSVSVVLSR